VATISNTLINRHGIYSKYNCFKCAFEEPNCVVIGIKCYTREERQAKKNHRHYKRP